MSLELWLGTQSTGQSVGVPVGLALPNGNTVIFSTASNSTQRHYTVIDPLGNVVTSGRITLAGNPEMVILGAELRADGGYDLLFGSGYQNLPRLNLVQLDANFVQAAPIQTVAAQFNGFGEMQLLANGELAILYGTFQSGTQNAGLRLVGTDGIIGPQITANTNGNPGPLFLQVAGNGERILTTWLDTTTQTVRARVLDLDGNPVGAEFSVTSSGSGDNTVQVETLSDGSFIVVWVRLQNNDPSGNNAILGRHFDANGVPIGNQFVISAAAAGGQTITGLTINDDGDFIVTREAQDGTLIRQFEANGTPVTGWLAVAGVNSSTAIVPIGDGRYIVSGSGTSAGYAVVDGRMGMFDGNDGDNLLVGSNSGPSTVSGFGGNDRFFGGNQDDTFIGGAGNDQFTPSFGNNTLIGGTGDDIYFLSSSIFGVAVDTIIELAGEGNDTVYTLGGFTLPTNVENVVVYANSGVSGAIVGNASSNRMTGNNSSNIFSGLGGNDFLYGFGGTDTLRGGDGNDLLDGGDDRDFLYGDAGNDQLLGGSGDDVLAPGRGTDRTEAGAGNDEIHFSNADEASIGDVVDGGEGFDYIILDGLITSFNLSLIATSSIEALTHFGSSLTLTLGVAQLNGLREIALNAPAEFRIADAGTVVLAGINAPSGLGNFRLSNLGNTVDASTLTTFNLAFEGGAGADIIRLGQSSGSASGGAGTDQLFGGNGDDTLNGGADADRLTGGRGNDLIDGGSNVDTAVVSGNRASYTVTQTSTGVFRVVGADGTDTLTGIEFLQFNDQTIRLLPGSGISVNFETANPAIYQSGMNAIRDFDGNALGGNGGWLRIGSADVNGDGDIDQILVNDAIGRFATVGTASDGLVYFQDFGWAGETRVAGIYIDPLVQSGEVVAGSDNDSQRRFQNDLQIENINRVLGSDDYDGDGIQEVFFALTDGTAYLRALMHEDGNIRYANYQSAQEVIDYLTANGYDDTTFGGWFSSGMQNASTQDDVKVTSVEVSEAVAPDLAPEPFGNGSDAIFSQHSGDYQWPQFNEILVEFYG